MEDIKNYKTRTRSLSSGQVLMRDYTREEARVVCTEMTEALCLDLVRESLVCENVSLYILYSSGESDGGSVRLPYRASAEHIIVSAMQRIYDRIAADEGIRRVNISFGNVSIEDGVQYSLFDDVEALEHDRAIQNTMIDIKKKYGLNAILKGINYTDASNARERNMQIGGHKSGNKTARTDAEDR